MSVLPTQVPAQGRPSVPNRNSRTEEKTGKRRWKECGGEERSVNSLMYPEYFEKMYIYRQLSGWLFAYIPGHRVQQWSAHQEAL